MSCKRDSPEQIIGMLREAEVCLSQGETTGQICRRRRCVDHLQDVLGISECRACQTVGQHRSTQRKVPVGRPDADALTAAIIRLATSSNIKSRGC